MKYDESTMKVKLCKKCKGLGKLVGVVFDTKTGEMLNATCPECNGTGRVILRNIKNEYGLDDLGENLSFDGETMKVRVCKACAGLGKFVYGPDDTRDCEECGGTGRIVHQEIVTEYQLHHLEEFEDA